MPRPVSNRVRNNYRLDPHAIATAQAALGTRTETETIESALRLVVDGAPPPAAAAADASGRASGVGKGSLAFAGTLPDADADAMLAAIEDGCERTDESATLATRDAHFTAVEAVARASW